MAAYRSRPTPPMRAIRTDRCRLVRPTERGNRTRERERERDRERQRRSQSGDNRVGQICALVGEKRHDTISTRHNIAISKSAFAKCSECVSDLRLHARMGVPRQHEHAVVVDHVVAVAFRRDVDL
jgi:hypothetical protein